MSSRAEHAIIYTYYSKKLLSNKFIIYYNLVTSPLRCVSISIIYITPLALGTLGLYKGLIYVVLFHLKSIFIMLFGLLYGLLMLRSRWSGYVKYVSEKDRCIYKRTSKDVVKSSSLYALKILKQVTPRLLIIVGIMTLLIVFNVFDVLNTYLSNTLSKLLHEFAYVRSEFITITTVSTVYPFTGFFVAGSMIENELVTIKESIVALFLGGMFFMIFFDLIRHSFPFYASVYPAKLAFKLSLSLIIADVITTSILILLILLIPV